MPPSPPVHHQQTPQGIIGKSHEQNTSGQGGQSIIPDEKRIKLPKLNIRFDFELFQAIEDNDRKLAEQLKAKYGDDVYNSNFYNLLSIEDANSVDSLHLKLVSVEKMNFNDILCESIKIETEKVRKRIEELENIKNLRNGIEEV